MIANWFHRLFNPHCSHCQQDEAESKICNSCETLKTIVEQLRRDNDKLVDALLDKHRMIQQEPPDEDLKPIRSFTPWRVRQQELEANSRKEAELAAKRAEESKSIEQLEEELLGEENAS